MTGTINLLWGTNITEYVVSFSSSLLHLLDASFESIHKVESSQIHPQQNPKLDGYNTGDKNSQLGYILSMITAMRNL